MGLGSGREKGVSSASCTLWMSARHVLRTDEVEAARDPKRGGREGEGKQRRAATKGTRRRRRQGNRTAGIGREDQDVLVPS